MNSNYTGLWADALGGTMWFFGYIGARIERVLEDADLTPLLGNIPELGQLVSILKCLPENAFDMDKFDMRMSKLSAGKSPKYKPGECRGIEPVEFLYLASLLIESYDNLSLEADSMIEYYRQRKKDVTIANWDKLTRAYMDAISSVLNQVDEDLAEIWKNHKWQVLGPLHRTIECLSKIH